MKTGSDEVFRTVLEGIHLLAQWDAMKETSGKPYLLPSMLATEWNREES
jgi:hypothetical protein